MKVKELILKLNELNQDSEIVMSSDAEGNNYANIEKISEDAEVIIIYPKHEDLENEYVFGEV